MNDFYATHSSVTDPGRYVDLFEDLPTSVAGIAYVVQGLVYHSECGHVAGGRAAARKDSSIITVKIAQMGINKPK